MVRKTVIIEGKETGLDEISAKAQSLDTNLDKIDSSSNKAGESLKKVGENGGAIATLDSLTGGLATRIRDGAEATKLLNFNLKATRGALIATGVGAFLVALGAIVAYWDDIVEFVTQTNAKLEEQINILERKSELLDAELSILDKQLELIELQGGNSEELRKKKIEILEAQVAVNNQELANLEIQRERLTNQALEVSFWDRILAAANRVPAISSISDEEQDEIDETTDRINTLRGSILDAQISLEKLTNPRSSNGDTTNETREQVEEPEKLPLTGLAGLDNLQTIADQEVEILTNANQVRTQLERLESEQRTAIADAEAQAKVESYMLAANGFAAASRLVGQETAAGKAFAVASTLASTYLSAQQAYASQFLPIPTADSPVRAAVAASIAVASGLANVREILKVQVPGGGGSGVSVGGGARPPAFNVVDSSPQNQLNQALLEQNDQPIEAFVVDKNVTSAQEARRAKIEASSF